MSGERPFADRGPGVPKGDHSVRGARDDERRMGRVPQQLRDSTAFSVLGLAFFPHLERIHIPNQQLAAHVRASKQRHRGAEPKALDRGPRMGLEVDPEHLILLGVKQSKLSLLRTGQDQARVGAMSGIQGYDGGFEKAERG